MRSWRHAFLTIVKRECKICLRNLHKSITPLLFFVMVLTLFPLTLEANGNGLHTVLAGIIWIALLFAQLLAAEHLFQQDIEDGVIEQWRMSVLPMPLLISAKLCAQWLLTSLPMIIITPLYALLLQLPWQNILVISAALILATPALLLIIALAAAFTAGIAARGMLSAIIVLPLVVPLIVFGAGSVNLVQNGEAVSGLLAMLAAISLLSLVSFPFAIAVILQLD